MKQLLIGAFLFFLFACGKNPDPGPNPEPTPLPPPDPTQSEVVIGANPIQGQTYSWSPADSLTNPKDALTKARPKKTTAYTLTATSKCGQTKATVTVRVYKVGENGELVEVK